MCVSERGTTQVTIFLYSINFKYFPPNTETTFKGLLLSLFWQLVLFMWNTRWNWWNWAWIFHNSALNQFLFVSWHCDTTCKQTQLKYKYRIWNFCNISATDLRYVFFPLYEIHLAVLYCLYHSMDSIDHLQLYETVPSQWPSP